MKNDQEIMREIRAAIDDCTSGININETSVFRYAGSRSGSSKQQPVRRSLHRSYIPAAAVMVLITVFFSGLFIWKSHHHESPSEQVCQVCGSYHLQCVSTYTTVDDMEKGQMMEYVSLDGTSHSDLYYVYFQHAAYICPDCGHETVEQQTIRVRETDENESI